jgi:hypothetical protein
VSEGPTPHDPVDGPDPAAQTGPRWIDPSKPPELLWGAVMTASEIELRDLHNRLWPHLRFDATGLRRSPATFRWLMAKRTVSRAHGEDASLGLASLAEGLTSVWQEHPGLQVEFLQTLMQGGSLDDLLKRFAEVAGLPVQALGLDRPEDNANRVQD